jgi:cytochrome c-type biogenesis protein CcmH/NrfG
MAAQQQKSRRQMLEEFVAANPNDAFALYGLALDCANNGDNDAALGHFQKLNATHPEYVAGYQQHAQLLARLARTDEARKVFQGGIAAALKAGNDHARSEMQTALDELG